jgi:two-component sensor histidine kinase
MYLLLGDVIARWPGDALSDSVESSDLIIQELEINASEKTFFPDGPLQLSFQENNLKLTYTVLDYENGPEYQFFYRFRETDQWVSLGTQRTLYLTNLTPGEYHVQLNARAVHGSEKNASFDFTIRPPFWRTWWFLFICIALIAGVAVYLYKRRIQSIQTRADLDRQIAEAEMKALHAQMNPHFIFNSLNSIREMMLNHDVREASRYLNVFAQLIRMTLLQSKQPYITLRNTMDYLQRYVDMEKIRNSDFTFQLYVDPELDEDETLLPPMLIQPFVENAIWHGMNGKDRAIHISVSFTKKEEQLVCIIRDDGVGIEESVQRKTYEKNKHQSVGISNIQQRIELLNQKHQYRSSVRIEDLGVLTDHRESGTQVILTLPLDITPS